MLLDIRTIPEIKSKLNHDRSCGKSIGFVPTMGALHAGHIELVTRAVLENDVVVVSIFVNPTQFNDKNDLRNYPRTPEKDLQMLAEAGVDYVFMPTEEEMYPEPDTRTFDFGNLDKVMEGAYRPGHFNGVAQVVSKLFAIVEPHRAYFGLKDYQQLAIIRRMVAMLNLQVEIVPCPIVREADGLAMSSRNLLLAPEKRASAPLIHQTLSEAKRLVGEKSVEETSEWVINRINGNPHLKVEYFQLAEAHSLQPITDWAEANEVIGCIAVRAGEIRLIDNMVFKQ